MFIIVIIIIIIIIIIVIIFTIIIVIFIIIITMFYQNVCTVGQSQMTRVEFLRGTCDEPWPVANPVPVSGIHQSSNIAQHGTEKHRPWKKLSRETYINHIWTIY